MKDIYYIDNESIKRTAKAIQKNSPNKKYTEILNDISTVLGYSSYNEYEHYLTNLILSKQSNFNELKALTKIDSLNLHMLENKFISHLKSIGHEVDSLYFIQSILLKQKEAIIEHYHLNIKDYVYYLPFTLNSLNTLTSDYFNYHKDIKPYIEILISFYKNDIGLDYINQLISKAKVISIESNFESDDEFKKLKISSETRGLYYYLKSIAEDLEYEEGLLTDMILKEYSTERIEFELNLLINKVSQEITIFFKENTAINDTYYTNIRNNISETNPIMFGMNPDKTPYFANPKLLRNNILICGIPGSGKSVLIHSLLYQSMMNNRGFCIFSPLEKVYSTKYVEHISKSLNKHQDIFRYNHNSNFRSIPNAINNNKIVIISSLEEHDLRRNVDYMEKSKLKFNAFLNSIKDYFYTANFKNKLIPFYILIEESHHMSNLDYESLRLIKELNNLNIFFIFDTQMITDNYQNVCDLLLITNGSLSAYANNSSSFELNKMFKTMINDKSIIGTCGPSKELPTVFSVILDGKYNSQFISEIDNELINIRF